MAAAAADTSGGRGAAVSLLSTNQYIMYKCMYVCTAGVSQQDGGAGQLQVVQQLTPPRPAPRPRAAARAGSKSPRTLHTQTGSRMQGQ